MPRWVLIALQIWGVRSHGYMVSPATRNSKQCPGGGDTCSNMCLVHKNVLMNQKTIPSGYKPCQGFSKGAEVGAYTVSEQVKGSYKIIAGHGGAARFFVCPDGTDTIDCFHKYPVEVVSETHLGRTQYWEKAPNSGCCNSPASTEFTLQMPDVDCPKGKCTLLWEWHNIGVGDVPSDSAGSASCTEGSIFFNCADISIDDGAEPTPAPEPEPSPSPSPTPEPYYTTTTPAPPAPPAQNPWNFMVWPEGNPVCLDVPGGDLKNGQPLQIWGCNGLSQQSWTFDNWQIKLRDANKCVDIPGGESYAGTVMQLWDCNGQDSQKFGYDAESRSIYAAGSTADATLCFDVAGGSDDFGASVWLWNCNHDLRQQQWYVPPNFGTYNIQSLMDGAFLCLDLLGQYTFNGNAVGAWDCNGFEGQSWIFVPGSWNIRWAKDTSKCVDVPGGRFESGTELWIWDCNGQESQMFGYDPDQKTIYAAASNANMCIDVPKDMSSGAKIWLWECNGASQQQWKVPSGEAWGAADLHLTTV